MKKLTTIFSMLLLVALSSSCKKESSLQQYLVESQNKIGFRHIDFPLGSMITAKTDVPEEIKETIKTIKKVNISFLEKTNSNDAAYEEEKQKLKAIFTNTDYKSLGSVKMKGINMKMYYIGNTDAVDEIIGFAYSKEIGVGVARLLGDDMNPAKILEMMNSTKLNADDILDQFSGFFKEK